MSEELKPCPFCGSEYIELHGGMHPKCNECGCEQSRVIGRKSVAVWNTRHIPEGYALVPLEPTREMVEALRDVISVTSRGGVLRAGIALKASIAAAQPQPE